MNHECGLAMIRLLKPISYYRDQYGDAAWGVRKLCLLMEKQRNRGQDNVGISITQFDMPPRHSYMNRVRSAKKHALQNLFTIVDKCLRSVSRINKDADDLTFKKECKLIGEFYLGHVRYATYAGRGIEFCQPSIYRNSIPSKSLAIAGNFNMTNSRDIAHDIIARGLVPSSNSDTHLIMHQLCYWLEKSYQEATESKSASIDILSAIKQAAAQWDGGYLFGGAIGNGDGFICRDPAGIRPGYYCHTAELFAAASERSALTTIFNVAPQDVKELPPAHVMIIKKNGTPELHQFTQELPVRKCTFERVYFSRPNDPNIYRERKALGQNIAERVFKTLDYDISQAVFSFIPNSAEIAFYGLIEEVNKRAFQHAYQQLVTSSGKVSDEQIREILDNKIRVEKLVFKDQVIRTFIAHEEIRSHLVANVYDVTRGVSTDQDTLVVLDDSIVRGTTLRESIIKQLIPLNPKRIIIVSAAPMILYPDCYGIDMSLFSKLIGFQAAVALTQERGNQQLLDDLYQECIALKNSKKKKPYNPIQKLYQQFSQQELEEKITQLIYPHDTGWNKELKIIYLDINGLQRAMPRHSGDWYFTGNYPTVGGYQVIINSYINWYTASSERAY